MTDRERKLLHDLREYSKDILHRTRDKSEAEYLANRDLRLVVERLFLIVGEAAARLTRESPELARKLTHIRGAVGFRNFLAHAYDGVDDQLVWRTILEDVGPLVREVEELLASD